MRVLMGDKGAPVPPDLTELQLCRDVYHCTPQELAKIDYGTIQRHLAVLSAEAQVIGLRSGAFNKERKKRGSKE